MTEKQEKARRPRINEWAKNPMARQYIEDAYWGVIGLIEEMEKIARHGAVLDLNEIKYKLQMFRGEIL